MPPLPLGVLHVHRRVIHVVTWTRDSLVSYRHVSVQRIKPELGCDWKFKFKILYLRFYRLWIFLCFRIRNWQIGDLYFKLFIVRWVIGSTQFICHAKMSKARCKYYVVKIYCVWFGFLLFVSILIIQNIDKRVVGRRVGGCMVDGCELICKKEREELYHFISFSSFPSDTSLLGHKFSIQCLSSTHILRTWHQLLLLLLLCSPNVLIN